VTPVDGHGNYFPGPEDRADASVASTTKTATWTGPEFDVDEAESLQATLTITAAAGTTPTLAVSLETTVDGTNWHAVGAFASKAAAGSDADVFGPLGKKARWKATIGGTTPSFTFAIAVKANN
jgi:hypothetical protein